ncbi:SOS response-associated peptidase [Pseudoclavibacter terrae]|uniref:SOS response-associated peptidase n=1 Tax=Pseudoclavibacter terrae TaxID=1530195 RepID=UPI00232C93BE|nr:SOS response-associated peptidase [Pseudoclavibacter terrae]
MCGRYVVSKSSSDLLFEFDAGGEFEWEPAYSVAPTNSAPILRQHEGEREFEIAKWGFRPSWAKAGGPPRINARLETVATNGLFRGAFAGSRCIVPMSGYYEWEEVEDGKQPYFISSPATVLAAAGLQAAYKDENDEWRSTFTIITREAKDASGEIHDRMPVFLEPEMFDRWISAEKIGHKDAMLHELDETSAAVASTITTRPVSRAVNNVRKVDRTDASLIEPITL